MVGDARDEAGSNGIVNDVLRHRHEILVGAQRMIVESSLPDSAVTASRTIDSNC
jgi:hypothetical protein